MTLDEIHEMILAGSDVYVTDSRSGADITAKVLAQIILEHDPPKLGIFPVELLHQLIRANEPLVRDFVDKYFNQALQAFLESQRQFDRYLRQVLGLRTSIPAGQDWARIMMGPFAGAFMARNGGERPALELAGGEKQEEVPLPASPENPAEAAPGGDLQEEVRRLREQLAALEDRLDRQRAQD